MCWTIGSCCWPQSDQITPWSTRSHAGLRLDWAPRFSTHCYCETYTTPSQNPARYAFKFLAQIDQHTTRHTLDRLLDLLSNLLSGQPYKPLGAPPSLGRNDVTAINRDHNPSQVCAALSLLSCFPVVYSLPLFRSMGLTKVPRSSHWH